MDKFKKYSKNILIAFVLLFVFKGFLYQKLVNYAKTDTRKDYAITNQKLIKTIEKEIAGKELTIDAIINCSLKLTAKHLKFKLEETSNNPNINFETQKAHCVGYAALCNSIGNYILEKKQLANTYKFTHVVGKIEFLGFDTHQLFKSPFFKDHDYNEIIHKQTGEKQFIDASVYDYTWIKRIRSN
ncbi:hypothetical protein [uncultured Kordia sp.]|uniref:hypothetical protein n=1 Tax=uncultured Kordia sp. TaxID=507699 RepID=UPI0026294427|nr:hypothetical protein [uncultured Kordia sp.]